MLHIVHYKYIIYFNKYCWYLLNKYKYIYLYIYMCIRVYIDVCVDIYHVLLEIV